MSYVTLKQLGKFVHTVLSDSIIPSIKKNNDKIAEKFKELEARIQKAEQQQKGLSFKGVYQRSLPYNCNDAVTHKGSLWICVHQTSNAPGDDPSAWQLAVKQGDAR